MIKESIMRDHLFRGRRKYRPHEWVYGDLLICYNNMAACIRQPDRYGVAGFFEVDPETVGEFTGFIDKNGKRAFEGDILKWESNGLTAYGVIRHGLIPNNDNPVRKRPIRHHGFYVEWQNDGENMWGDWWRCDLCFWLGEDCVTIAGNVFDNPELLEG